MKTPYYVIRYTHPRPSFPDARCYFKEAGTAGPDSPDKIHTTIWTYSQRLAWRYHTRASAESTGIMLRHHDCCVVVRIVPRGT